MMCLLHCWEMSNLPMGITQPVIFFVPNLTPADVSVRLRTVGPELFRQVQMVLARNKAERHLRGGAATREKYHKPH